MAIELRFKQPPLTDLPLELRFGVEEGGPTPPEKTINASGRMPAIRGSGRMGPVRVMNATGKMRPMTSTGAMIYTSRTSRPTVNQTTQKFQQARNVSVDVRDTFANATLTSYPVTQRWQDFTPMQREIEQGWQEAIRVDRDQTIRYQDALPVQTGIESRFQQSIQVRNEYTSRYQDAIKTSITPVRGRFQQALKRRSGGLHRWQDAIDMQVLVRQSFGHALPFRFERTQRYQDALWPPIGQWVKPGPQPPDPCYIPPPGGDVQLVFSQSPSTGKLLLFSCETHGEEPSGETIVVPVKRIYIVQNNVWVKHLASGEMIPTISSSLDIDVDSWTFKFSAVCPREILDVIDPTADGPDKEIEMSINGRVHRLRIEDMQSDRRFGGHRINISGRGRSAVLDKPYSGEMNFFNEADRTAQQLIGDVLSVNGVPMDWEVNFGLENWNVPGGVFAHRGTYASAVNSIALAAGGYVQPHASLEEIYILPRYPVAPWNWATAVTPDFELPSAVVKVEGIEWLEKSFFNGVYVSGQQQGVLAHVRRPATIGDILAQQVTDPLITDAVAARQRGQAILSDVGKQAKVTLSLPVLALTNIIMPGKFVSYVDGATERLGIVRATSVQTQLPKVEQRIVVETFIGL